MERKVTSRLVMLKTLISMLVLSSALLSVSSIDSVLGIGGSEPVGPHGPLYRGGTFGYMFLVSTMGYPPSYSVSVRYWLATPFEPLIISYDPQSPVTVPGGGEYRVYFNWTIPADAPLGPQGITHNLFLGSSGFIFGMHVHVSVLSADIDFDPAYIHVGDGDWIYCHIEPPEPMTIHAGVTRSGSWSKMIEYSPNDINVSTVRLNDTIPAEPSFAEVSDFDGDGMLDLKVAFNRSDIESYVLHQGIMNDVATLSVTGQFLDGWAFAGSNQVEVVLTPEQAIRDLIDIVESMNLQQGIDNSLDSKLTAVLDALEALNADQRNDAVNKLNAFINEVEAQRGKKLTDEQADYLSSEAQRIIDLIEEPNP